MEKRYARYLEMVRIEMFTGLIDARRNADMRKKLKEQFPEPEYTIIGINGRIIE